MVLRGFTSALGRAGPVMIISIGGVVMNFALNYALLHGLLGLPHLGLMGIGLVTALVANSMALLLALHIRRHPAYARYAIRQGLMRPSLTYLKELWRLGLPIGGTYAVEIGLFTFAAFCMGAMGRSQMAEHQIALQSVSMAFMIPVGISYAMTMRIGSHYGAGNLQQARLAGRVGIAFGSLMMLAFGLLFWLAPYFVAGLFLDATNPANHDVIDGRDPRFQRRQDHVHDRPCVLLAGRRTGGLDLRLLCQRRRNRGVVGVGTGLGVRGNGADRSLRTQDLAPVALICGSQLVGEAMYLTLRVRPLANKLAPTEGGGCAS